MHVITRGLRVIAIGLVVALVVACGAGSDAAPAGASDDLTIGFASPTNGADVQVPFDVQLESSVPLGDPETGNHHAHLYFDTEPGAADYDIVYGTTWQVTRELAPGDHTITVALANPDHSLAGPSQSIDVTVGSDGGAGGSGGEPAPSVPGIDY